jgi:O-acetylhomoserine (thiol)-lyase
MTYRPETLAVHAGQEQPDPATNSRAVPIYQTTSYVFDDTEHAADLFALRKPGNIYTRIMNPTQSVLETRVNALEGGVGALALASGASAVTYAVLNLATAGDNFVALSTLYGGTFALFAHTLKQFDIEVRFVDPTKPEDLARHVDDRTKLVFGETVGNPAINVIDLDAWSEAAHALGLPFVVDNTVPTPYLTRVFDHGVDVAVHAATKYLGGHGNSLGGVIVDSGNFDWNAHAERFASLTGPDPAYHGVVWTDAAGPAAYIIRARTVLLRNMGAAIAPLNSFLILQGIETLHLRMERHCSNALAVARFLEGHDREADPEGRIRRPGLLRPQGRTRRRAAVRRGARPVQPPGQHRRRQVAGHPQRIDDALAAVRRGAGGRRRGAGDGAPLPRHRARRRPDRRPVPGPRQAALTSSDTRPRRSFRQAFPAWTGTGASAVMGI